MRLVPRCLGQLTANEAFWPVASDRTAGTWNNCFRQVEARVVRQRPKLSHGDHFFKMKGNELFKVAVRSMAEVSREVLEEAGVSAKDVKLFIPHQANQRITDAVASKLNVDEALVYSNISMHETPRRPRFRSPWMSAWKLAVLSREI